MSDNPFKGLNTFTEEDADFFFGRETEIENIIDNFRVERLTILYGESGVGKSSILRAGVAHDLIREAKQNVKKDNVPKLAIVVFPPLDSEFSWQEDPLTGLKKQIEKDIKKLLLEIDIPLPDPKQSFVETLRHWTKFLDIEGEEGELFIILDQFEEYFLYPQEDREGTFAIEFPRAVNCRDLAVNFLISIRSDYFTKLDYFEDRILNLVTNRLELKPLSLDLAKEAIQGPINAYNKRNKLYGKDEIRIEDNQLVPEILKQIEVTMPGGIDKLRSVSSEKVKRVEASLLQVDLECLWDEEVGKGSKVIRYKTFLKLGETKEITKELVKKRLNKLDENQKSIAASLLHFLVTPHKHKIALPTSHLKYFANDYRSYYPDLSPLTDEEVESLLKILIDPKCRILRHRADDCYEIFHDVLSDAILSWQSGFIRLQKDKKAAEVARKFEEFKKSERLFKVEIAKKILMNLRSYKDLLRQDEKVALLARQAYLLNRDYEGDLLNEVDDALYQVVNIPYFSSVLRNAELNSVKVSSVAFFPDSKRCVAGIFNELALGNIDWGFVQFWDLEEKTSSRIVPPNIARGVLAVAISPDAKKLAFGSADKTVRVYDIENYPDVDPTPLSSLPGHQGDVWCVAFSPNGQILASAGSDDQTVLLWDMEHLDKSPIAAFKHNDWVWSVAFRPPNGETLAVGCRNGEVYLWNPKYSKEKPFKTLNIFKKPQKPDEDYKHEYSEIFSVAFSPDGKKLAIGSKEKTIRVWDWNQLDHEPKILQGHVDTIRTIAFSPDSQWLASGSNFCDRTIRLWNLQNIKEFPVLEGHKNGISSVAFSRNGQWLLSGSWDGSVRLWELKSPSAYRIFQKYGDSVKGLAVSSDGKMLAAGGNDRIIRLWNLGHPDEVPIVLEGHEREVSSVTFHPQNSEILASGSYDCTVRVWNWHQPLQPLAILKSHEGEVSSVAFSPHESYLLASGSHDGKVRVWNWQQPYKPLAVLKDHHWDKISSVAFSPCRDNKILASGSYDQTVRLWNWQEKELVGEPIVSNQGGITSISFSADGKRLALATNHQIVGLWDLKLLQAPRWIGKYSSLKGISVAFNPKEDSHMLASGGYNGEVWLWDLQKPDADPIRLEGHTQDIRALAFSPDGQYLVSGGNEGTIRLDMVNTQKLADLVCQRVWCNLSKEEWDEFVGSIPYEKICPNLPLGEGVSGESRADLLRQDFEEELKNLLPGQRSLLQMIERRVLEKDVSALRGDVSEEEIAMKLKKPQPKGDEATYQRLEALKESGFLERTDKGFGPGTVRYGLSNRYLDYLKLVSHQIVL